MNKDDMILISVDDHIVEPPDMFKNHLPKKYADEAPRLVHNPDGSDTWQFRDIVIPNVALNAVAGRPKEEYGLEPQGLDEIRKGCYNVDERVKDMNAGGILGSICFPSFPGFAGRLFATEDPEFSLALVQAYNDWHIDEWCGAYPARFIPMALPVIWDAEACADEVRRVSKKGVHALTFTENPAAMGYPSFHDDYWTPLWKALCDTNTVLNVHIGSSGKLAITAPDAPLDVMITLQPMNIVQAAADLLWSKPIKDYPDLKIGLSEGGTGWIPYFLERVDRTYEMHSTWTHQNFGGKLPSEVFREHFLTCFISDPVGVTLRDKIGVDNIAWEADYPHSDSMWPGAPEELWDVLTENNVPDDEINKMTHENAMRWYSFDPFTHISREQATVGALRKAAEGHDVSIQALSHHEQGTRGDALHAAARGNSGSE
ncbi:amidohydrolase [Mycolicibacterium boenickei]|uniref:Amidohydrolase n=1 Tax=Mycolicibacterium boenickei TaxID=146017 RepID=A0AAX2ZT69_9MYCO|nr:amidohydrolase family protein [Mycolicibacterium boenickei]PEG60662.1 amidohydrolase [Mycolicibacterium boenickei]UNB97880.1 amidohydrolase [Mycolicibacterium boenickei]BBX93621.1 amidohydrolase [Mycolicibacterium boenickei]